MSGVTDTAIAVLLGGALAAGLLCILASAPRWRAASLTVRIAPYVRDVVPDEALPAGVLPRAGVLPDRARRVTQLLSTALRRPLGDDQVLTRRLRQAGSDRSVLSFRGRQLAALVAGLAFGGVLLIVLALGGRITTASALLPVVTAAAGAIAPDLLLSQRVRARRARLTDELPTTVEFLALCLSAGEGFLDAIRRVAMVGSGELTEELRQVVLAVGTGSPLAEALREMSARLELPGLTRAVDQVVAALEQGAPLAAVLHAQASDAREEAKRHLIEQAGRREIVMLLPLVFLILPISVLFAVFPGVFILRLGLG